MSRAREKRIERVAQFYEQKLDARVAELTSASQQEKDATQKLEAAQAKVQSAQDECFSRLSQGTTASDWAMDKAWQETLARRQELAAQHRVESEKAVTQARQQVLAARSAVARIDTIVKRMADSRIQAETRTAQKMEDEWAAIRFVFSAGSSSK